MGCSWIWGKTESVIWQNISTKKKKLRTKGCSVSIFEVRTIDYSLFPKHFNAVKQIFTIHFKLQMLWWAVMDEGLTKMTFSDSVLQGKFHPSKSGGKKQIQSLKTAIDPLFKNSLQILPHIQKHRTFSDCITVTSEESL